MRRSVYQAIDRQDSAFQGAQKLSEAPGALLCTEFIGEFFEFHGLQHSLCVFQTEAQLPLKRGREALAADAGLGQPIEGSSLLQQLIRTWHDCGSANEPADLKAAVPVPD